MAHEQLLKLRYKVIADYPNSPLEVGQVLSIEGSDNDIDGFLKHPHIFKKLEWWEEREAEKMPKYLKDYTGRLFKVRSHFDSNSKDWRDKNYNNFAPDESHLTSIGYMGTLPATEEEYNEYVKQKATAQ